MFSFLATHPDGRQPRAARPRLAYRPGIEALEARCLLSGGDVILRWNAVALDAVKADYALGHTPDQGGPTRDSRALAIVHAATFDAVNSIDGRFTPYLTTAPHARGASRDAAVAAAAHDTLVHLYPSQTTVFDTALTDTLAGVPDGPGEDRGLAVGRYVAAAILAARAGDGSDATGTYRSIGKPGHHQPDPLHPDQGFLTSHWGKVAPFAVANVKSFRSPPPAAMTSAEYTAAFEEVARLGGDGVTTPTQRTAEQTQIGHFWAYDGSPGLGTPPRQYNQIVRVVAAQQHNTVVENARLFALVNVAMADAGIQAWDMKYVYDFWRPVVAIRAAQTDGNPDTDRIADWTPLGAPRSNDPGGTNFTPPFPAYTSGHATFGAAAFRTLAQFYGRDDVTFSFTSDELNGATKGQDGAVRPRVTRTYHSFSEATEENGQSRIYLGIHWSFDKVSGMQAGNAIADFVFQSVLQPRGHGQGKHEGAGPVGLSALVGQDLVAAPLFESADLFSDDAVTLAAPGGQPPTVADQGRLVAVTPSKDFELATSSDQEEEGRIDLLFSEDALFDAIELDDELSWVGN